MNAVLGILGAAVLFALFAVVGRHAARRRPAGGGGACPPEGCASCTMTPACPESDRDER